MFTGIIEEVGSVHRPGTRLEIECAKVGADSGPGASIAVSGVCLTVVDRVEAEDGKSCLAFDLSPETLSRSSLGQLRAGGAVNLERPLTLLSRLGGHLVQGHVDGLGTVADIRETGPGTVLAISLPSQLAPYVVEKGPIAVDGTSLTVTGVGVDRFEVSLIPHTLEATTLGSTRVGDRVNLEVDVVAKYLAGLLRRAG
jgi:riboflavin synthase